MVLILTFFVQYSEDKKISEWLDLNNDVDLIKKEESIDIQSLTDNINIPDKKRSVVQSFLGYIEPQVSMSGRRYLREVLHYNENDIDNMVAINKKNKQESKKPSTPFFATAQSTKEIIFTWCNGDIQVNDLIPLEGKTQPNCFYLFPPDEFFISQGCGPNW